MRRVRHPQKLGDRLTDPDARQSSFVALFDGWLGDLLRLHSSLLAHMSGDWELVVVDNPGDDASSERIASLERVVHLPLRDRVGFAAGRNLGLRLSTGRLAIVVDTSVSLEGDVLGPLEHRLDDPAVGLVGRWGVVTRDGFSFSESEGVGAQRSVDGVEAYFMALRRKDLSKVGLFDPKFRWYRNADLDFSFRMRDAGYLTVVDPSLPVRRHAHRTWENTPEHERDDLSRKNFLRFRDHWGERRDLLVAPDD